MSQPPAEQNLAKGKAAWEARVKAALPPGSSLASLASRTFEGLVIEPLYTARRDATPLLTGRFGWEIAQRVDNPDPRLARVQALDDLENGAQSLTIVLAEGPAARGFGLAPNQLDEALEGVDLSLISVRLDGGGGAAADALCQLTQQRGIAPDKTVIDFGLDPIGGLAVGSHLSTSEGELARSLAEAIEPLRDAGYGGTSLIADGRPYHEAGCGEAQELAFVLATVVDYLRLLDGRGWSLDTAARQISTVLTADASEFLTLSKFRAWRRLWASMERYCGLQPRPARVHAETAWRMMSSRDPWTNILRTTLATFAAVAGGADVVTILPCSLAFGLPDPSARRLARNTQLILQHESHLDKVADPAAGAGAFESLSDSMCHGAWAIFTAIERLGGMVAALRSGHVQQLIEQTREKRLKALAERAEPLTGVSEFVDLAGPSMPVLARTPKPAARPSAALPSLRDSEPFEQLRAEADDFAKTHGARPRIYLACLGKPSSFTARATFAKNFFEAGGIEAVLGASVLAEKVGADFRQAQADLVCLCGSDAVYARDGVDFVFALTAAGARYLYLAGRPANWAELSEAGVTAFIADGDDLVALLASAHALLRGKAKAQ
jgi:methylmalonyl-CoA mutase